MMRCKRDTFLVAGLVAVLGLAGCSDWESSDDESAWNEGYNWLDFSGVYSDMDGGVLVRAGDGFSDANQPDSNSATVTDQATTTGAMVNSGIVSGAPIVPGTLSIVISKEGVFSGTLVDDNNDGIEDSGDTDGQLESATDPSLTGTVIYETGAWTISYATIDADVTITLTYQQASTGGSSTAFSETGEPIYSFNVLQTGERLRLIDSNGNEFEGRLFDVNSSAGDLTAIPSSGDENNPQVGHFVASFYAEGSIDDVFVTLDGTFNGSILESEGVNTLFDRSMRGSWRQSDGQSGVFMGSTDPVTTTGTVTP